jgi:hypothetical protein
MCATVVLCVFDSIGNFEIPQPSKWQCIRDQIKAAFITARADFVNVNGTRNALAND